MWKLNVISLFLLRHNIFLSSELKFEIEKKPTKERIKEVKDEIMNEIEKLYNQIKTS